MNQVQTAYFYNDLAPLYKERACNHVFETEYAGICEQIVSDLVSDLYKTMYGISIEDVDYALSDETYTLLFLKVLPLGNSTYIDAKDAIRDTAQMVIDTFTDELFLEEVIEREQCMFTQNGRIL